MTEAELQPLLTHIASKTGKETRSYVFAEVYQDGSWTIMIRTPDLSDATLIAGLVNASAQGLCQDKLRSGGVPS